MTGWNVIVLTCPTASLAVHVEQEVELLRMKGRLSPHVALLTVEDPAENIGSGAATLNALFVATEYLSVQKSYSVVNSDALTEAHVLILHQGRQCVYSGCMKSFITIPKEWTPYQADLYSERYAGGIYTNLEMLLQVVEKLSVSSPPGVWICSTDMTLLPSSKEVAVNWDQVADVVMFCVPTDVQYASDHGCVLVDKEGFVANVIYAGSQGIIQKYVDKEGKVLIISGIVYVTPGIAESLLAFHLQSPLESCTYVGLDSGADPVQVSLFFDILMAMATNITEEEFLSGKFGKSYNIKFGYSDEHVKQMISARSLVWKELSRFRMTAAILDCCHFYWSDHLPAKNYLNNLFSIMPSGQCHSLINVQGVSSGRNLMVNSIIDVSGESTFSPDTVVVNSKIKFQNFSVGCGSCINGLNTDLYRPSSEHSCTIPMDTVISCYYIPDGIVIVAFGTSDQLMLPVADPRSTFANKPWSALFDRLKTDETAVWDQNLASSKRTLLTAKLFVPSSEYENFLFLVSDEPSTEYEVRRWNSCHKYSIAELTNLADYRSMMSNRRNLYAEIAAEEVKRILVRNEKCSMLLYFMASCAEGWSKLLMDTLDTILLSEKNSIVLTRTLSNMADLLASMAGRTGGLRSGPGSNKAWLTAFKCLLNDNTYEGMKEMKQEREKWLDTPNHMMRAARHYERAAQILIQNSVKSAKTYMTFLAGPLSPLGSWVTVECPSRIDLQGGWTDTPPICYELGGSVVNIATLIDGKKPIGAKACRKDELNVELVFGPLDSPTVTVLEEMEEILDYDQPYARGALLKAALICAGMVDPSSHLTLKEQLAQNCMSGIVLHSWSTLPQGCGMGASSILAGAVIAVLWLVSGKHFDKAAVIHAVLHTEQLLTTGGGWQDQVGGIMGGVNLGFSKPCLPLHVEVDPIPVESSFLQKLERQFLLIYTGKVRLAKNILQSVIRNWYARDPSVVTCFENLISSSLAMKKALTEGSLMEIGVLMNSYWEQKKILAPGCEPASVRLIMESLSPFCYGQILTGAGGGGFMCILTKEPDLRSRIEGVLSTREGTHGVTCHTVKIDHEGMTVRM